MILQRNKTTYGYILIEVVVSMVVFSIGVVSVLRTFSVAAQARAVAQDYTVAAFLCQKVMTESQAARSPKEGIEEGDFGEAFPKFRWVRTVELIKAEPTAAPEEREGLAQRQPLQGPVSPTKGSEREADQLQRMPITYRRILVTILWQRKGAEYSVSVETLVPVMVTGGI
jgi:type II secretory pathway pseudopilin PulG